MNFEYASLLKINYIFEIAFSQMVSIVRLLFTLEPGYIVLFTRGPMTHNTLVCITKTSR